MANAKISDAAVFKTDVIDVLDIDGFAAYSSSSSTGNAAMSGTQLVSSLETRISLSNMTTGILGTTEGGTGLTSISTLENANVDYATDGNGTLPVGKGGTGITDFSLANFENANVNYASDGTGVLPADHGGTGVAGTAGQKVWNAVQQFVWDGSPIALVGIPNAQDTYLPFNATAIIDTTANTAANTKWVASNAASGTTPSQECTFTLGADGGGVWRIDVMYSSFNLINFVEARLSLDIDGAIIPVYGKSYAAAGSNTGSTIQSLAGNLTYEFSGGEEVKVQIRIDGSGSSPFPGNTAPWTNRPPEITFTRIV